MSNSTETITLVPELLTLWLGPACSSEVTPRLSLVRFMLPVPSQAGDSFHPACGEPLW